jgi:type I restriction enzyme S subunit
MKEGWEIKTLGEVCKVVGGGTPSKNRLEFYGGTINWASVRDLNSETLLTTEHTITTLGLQNSSTNLIAKNNVIFASRVGLGKVCMTKIDVAINQDLRAPIPKNPNQLDVVYLFRWFQNRRDIIIKAGQGATVQGITLPFINNLPIPIPPLSEQQRIVSIIDEAFEAIDKAIENTQKNLQNAKELFESYLNNVFEKGGEGWEENNLDATCVKFDDGNWIESKDQSKEGIRLIQTGNIGLGKFIDKQDKARYISEETFKRLKCTEIYPGDILISRLPDPVGKACQIPLSIKERMITGVDCTIVRLKPSIITDYLLYFQLSKLYLNQVKKLVSGTTRDRISRKNLGIIKVPIAPYSVQQKLIKELDVLNGETEFLQSQYQQKLRDLEELKKSVLNKAFAGEL